MGNVNNLIGQKFGLLTVLERDYEAQKKTTNRHAFWKCQCECGNIVSRSSNALKTIKKPSCGCINNQREAQIKDLTNQKFGKLTVLSRNNTYSIEQKNKGIKTRDSYWNCICECGRTCVRGHKSLITLYESACEYCTHKKDLTNTRKYMLTMLYPTGEKHGKYTMWHCKCDCGNEVDYDTNELSWTVSCGCVQHKSKGEIKIENLLKENNISYIYNKGYFKDLVYASGIVGRYDFILLNENNKPFRIVEFDGKQHYDEKANIFFCGPNSKTTFKQNQEHDKIKNEYAKKNNLPLVRIPYTMLNKLTLETILGDEFLV